MEFRVVHGGEDLYDKYQLGPYPPVFRYNNTQIARVPGGGVGVCPPNKLPDSYESLPGTLNRFSPEYGNYFHPETRSFYVYIPAVWSRLSGNTLSFAPEETSGYVLERAFIDSGTNYSGLMIMKYPMHLADGLMCSRPGYEPFQAQTNPGSYAGLLTPVGLPNSLKTAYRSASMSGFVPLSIFAYYLLVHIAATITRTAIRNPVTISATGNSSVNCKLGPAGLMRNGISYLASKKYRTGNHLLSHNGEPTGILFNPMQKLLLPGLLRYDGGIYVLTSTSSVDSITLGTVSTSLYTLQTPVVNTTGIFYSDIMFPENSTEDTRTAYYTGYPALDTPVAPDSEIESGYGTPVYDYSLSALTNGIPVANVGDYGHKLTGVSTNGDYTIRLMEFI